MAITDRGDGLIINSNSWYNRVYEWWHFDTYGWKNGSGPANTVNLCPYMRAILFWSWLRLFFWRASNGRSGKLRTVANIISWFSLLVDFNLAVSILSYHGHGKPISVWFMFFIEGIVVFCAGSVLGLIVLAMWSNDKRIERKMLRGEYNEDGTSLPFIRVVKTWLHGVHNHICPIVTVEPNHLPPPSEFLNEITDQG